MRTYNCHSQRYLWHLLFTLCKTNHCLEKKLAQNFQKFNNPATIFLVQGGPVTKSHLKHYISNLCLSACLTQKKFSEVLSLGMKILGIFKNGPSAD